jgi:hypothetical protein
VVTDKGVVLEIKLEGAEPSMDEIQSQLELLAGELRPAAVLTGIRREGDSVFAVLVREEVYREAVRRGPRALAELSPWEGSLAEAIAGE